MMKHLILLFVVSYTSLSGWYIEKQYPADYFQYVSIVDTGVVWAIGFYGQTNDTQLVALRTPTGWQKRPSIGLPFGFLSCVSIAGTDSLNAFVGTRTGKVYRTTNSGVNWILQIDAGGGYINDIQFSKTDPAYGYIFCNPPAGPGATFRIYKTSNYGDSWTTFSPFFGPDMVGYDRSISVTDSNHAWFGLYCTAANCLLSKIAYTNDGGATWNTMTVPAPDGYGVTDIEFRDDNTYALASCQIPGDDYHIYRTTNSGTNWSSIYTLPVPGEIHNLKWIKNSNDWYYCITNEVRKSSNNGSSWSLSISLSGTDQFTHMDAINAGNKTYAWAVGNTGSMMKMVDSNTTIGIQSVSNLVPAAYSLDQNYPNPFNPVTSISFGIPQSGNAKLTVFDILGREVAVLVNENLTAGEYKINFNASNLPSGVYMYRLNVNGDKANFTDTKKLILVK